MLQHLPSRSTDCTPGDTDRHRLTNCSWGSHYEHPHFTDEEMETLTDQVAWPKLQSWLSLEPRFNPNLWF